MTSPRQGGATDLGSLWVQLLRRSWTTLAVVSPDAGDAAVRLARGLTELAGPLHRVVEAGDASELKLKLSAALGVGGPEGAAAESRHLRFVLPLDGALDRPQTAELLAACDGVVLLLEKGRSRIPDAQRALGLVGRERLVGAVLALP